MHPAPSDSPAPDDTPPLEDLRLDRDGSTPLYLQVRHGLTRLIQTGRFGIDDALPSERSLAEHLDISRVTARKAIDSLVDDGLIVRRHGSGSYVAPKLEQPLTRLTSFTEQLMQRGFVPSSRWVRRAIGEAVPAEIMALALPTGARVARLDRVRLADGIPVAFEASTLPIDLVPDPEAVEHSLYDYLAARSSVPVRALQHLRAANATARHAELLDIPTGEALLFVTRIGYAEDGHPIEVTHTWCRSDSYDFVIELRR